MHENEEIMIAVRKKKIGKTAAVFFSGMIGLAFLSNTINNLSLPKVKTEYPSRGSIVREITANGKIEERIGKEFYIPSAMRVLEVNVHTGDYVTKGRQLMKLDTASIEKQLMDTSDRYEQKKVSLDLMKLNAGTDLAVYDEAIEKARIQLERAEADYERISVLAGQGSETMENLKSAARKLDDARLELTKATNARENALLLNQAEAQKNEMEIRSLMYDIEILKREIEQLRKLIAECEITAPFDGIITTVNCSEGQIAGTSEPLCSIMDINGGFCFKGLVDKELAGEIKPGDEAELTLNGQVWQKFRCKVVDIRSSIEYAGEKVEIELELPEGQWSAGQKGSVRFEKRSAEYEFLVSNSAIGKDNNGYFVYIPEEKKGYLGNEIYIRAVHVSIGESDDEKTAIVQGLSREDRVIVSSDKPLADNMRVIWDPQ